MEDIERTPFGRRLFEARGDKFSQEDAAKAVGMSQSTLSEAEISGKRSGFTSQLAVLYKVNSTWLATGNGNKELGAPPALIAVQPESLKEQVIKLLAGMQEYYANAWMDKVKGDAAMQRAEQRAAQEARQQHEESFHRDDKPGDPSLPERRRASN